MIAKQAAASSTKWIGRNYWRAWGVPEFGLLLLLFLLLAIILYLITAEHATFHATQLSLTTLDQDRLPLELKGTLFADSQQAQITTLHFVLALAPAAPPLDLTAGYLTLRYQDATRQLDQLPWRWRFLSGSNENSLLEEGERVELIVPLSTVLTPGLGANTTFRLELAAPQRRLFSLQRTTPSLLATQLELP